MGCFWVFLRRYGMFLGVFCDDMGCFWVFLRRYGMFLGVFGKMLDHFVGDRNPSATVSYLRDLIGIFDFRIQRLC
ncbi:hypothetical protein DPMN_118363 [Dreissena polymorpha]|uniref:Uncharacterized protein n=1 Tax=Dreissena polymorpha TaxID=45954 RepID=A0A9D4GKM2_DREPO|nr:hypothetical protein DPMN_118363 [Dreissena polymorpha]